jgi:hypothetical protein
MDNRAEAFRQRILSWQEFAAQVIAKNLLRSDEVDSEDPRYFRIRGTDCCGHVNDEVATSRGLLALRLAHDAVKALEFLENNDNARLAMAVDNCRGYVEQIRHADVVTRSIKQRHAAQEKADLRHEAKRDAQVKALAWLKARFTEKTRGQWIADAKELFDLSEGTAKKLYRMAKKGEVLGQRSTERAQSDYERPGRTCSVS